MTYTFVSGATGGIGKAFVFECAKQKQNLFLTGRSIEKLESLKQQIVEQYDVDVQICACMLDDEQSRADMFAFIDSIDAKFDKIINVAGVDIQKGVMDYTLSKLIFQMRVNVEATITNTYSLLQRRADEVQVVTISSMSGVSPMPYFALYSATKCCLTNFFSSLRIELKKQGVKVTTVLPGGVPTRPDIIQDIKGQGLWGIDAHFIPSVQRGFFPAPQIPHKINGILVTHARIPYQSIQTIVQRASAKEIIPYLHT